MSRTILVADDEPFVLRSIEFILKKEGYAVLTATDGQEALDKIRAERPELVFLDIQMPRLDGNSVCRALREDPACQGLHVIMITAKGQELDRIQSMECGADEFITKPFSPRKLVERVRAVLGA